MSSTKKRGRQNVTLSSHVAQRVRPPARAGHTTASRVQVELSDRRLESKENKKKRFMELADRLAATKDPAEQKRLKAALAHLTFGG